MTLANGTPGAARPGEDGRPAGQLVGRGTPQSGIPTQGAPPADWGSQPPRPSGPFAAPFSAPPGAVPPPRPTPPPGPPAQRSALSIGAGPSPDPGDDRTSLVDRSEPSTTDRWKKAVVALRQRGAARWGLLGALAVVQVFLLFSAVMWWVGSSTPSASATMTPMTWTGVVYDVGAAGVNLRSATQVRPDDARDTAARGARLALQCGETGDVVAKGPVKTATWVKTTDGLFVSMLYVRIPDRASIPSCDGSKVDGPLLALADPAHPALPPPPGTHLDGSRGRSTGSEQDASASGSHDNRSVAPGGVPPAAPTASPPGVVTAAPAAPRQPLAVATVPLGTATAPAHHDAPRHQTTPAPTTTTAPPTDPDHLAVG